MMTSFTTCMYPVLVISKREKKHGDLHFFWVRLIFLCPSCIQTVKSFVYLGFQIKKKWGKTKFHTKWPKVKWWFSGNILVKWRVTIGFTMFYYRFLEKSINCFWLFTYPESSKWLPWNFHEHTPRIMCLKFKLFCFVTLYAFTQKKNT